MGEAVGIVELYGLVAAFAAADAGCKAANVTEYRYCLVESDDMSLEKQYAMFTELKLPIATLTHSGGKSLHAIVKVNAANRRGYQQRWRG